uniref:Uncharacterized protein n=1 Tax=Manihot esculenta TaxID=3983 RepID=A0A2C9U3M7_MANES
MHHCSAVSPHTVGLSASLASSLACLSTHRRRRSPVSMHRLLVAVHIRDSSILSISLSPSQVALPLRRSVSETKRREDLIALLSLLALASSAL